jgi:hypothetical protein
VPTVQRPIRFRIRGEGWMGKVLIRSAKKQ